MLPCDQQNIEEANRKRFYTAIKELIKEGEALGDLVEELNTAVDLWSKNPDSQSDVTTLRAQCDRLKKEIATLHIDIKLAIRSLPPIPKRTYGLQSMDVSEYYFIQLDGLLAYQDDLTLEEISKKLSLGIENQAVWDQPPHQGSTEHQEITQLSHQSDVKASAERNEVENSNAMDDWVEMNFGEDFIDASDDIDGDNAGPSQQRPQETSPASLEQQTNPKDQTQGSSFSFRGLSKRVLSFSNHYRCS